MTENQTNYVCTAAGVVGVVASVCGAVGWCQYTWSKDDLERVKVRADAVRVVAESGRSPQEVKALLDRLCPEQSLGVRREAMTIKLREKTWWSAEQIKDAVETCHKDEDFDQVKTLLGK